MRAFYFLIFLILPYLIILALVSGSQSHDSIGGGHDDDYNEESGQRGVIEDMNELERVECRHFILWADYLAGIYTLSEAWTLVTFTKNEMLKKVVQCSKYNLDKLLVKVLESINDRIPVKAQDNMASSTKPAEQPSRDWLNEERSKCMKHEKVCQKLEEIVELLNGGKIEKLYQEISGLQSMESSKEFLLTEKVLLASSLAILDFTTADSCVPIWPSDIKPNLKQMWKIVKGLLSIVIGREKPKNTGDACSLLGLKDSDPTCLYGLVAISFPPAESALLNLKDGPKKGELLECLQGRKDPCSVLNNQSTAPQHYHDEKMLANFREKCEWNRGVEAIIDACPNPNATLPLRRAIDKSLKISEGQKEAIANDEKWFWVHIYTQQCEAASYIQERLRNLIRLPNGAIAFALGRMALAKQSCKPWNIPELEQARREEPGVLSLLAEGQFDKAQRLYSNVKGISDDLLEYYKLVELLLKHPRVLEISGLVSRPLLVLNDLKRNKSMISLLDAVKVHGKVAALVEGESPQMSALLLVLAGHGKEALTLYESTALLKGADPFLAELMAVARICEATTFALCEPKMQDHLKLALRQVHLRQRDNFYKGVLEQLCMMATANYKTDFERVNSFENNSLFPIVTSKAEIFAFKGFKLYRFPNDPACTFETLLEDKNLRGGDEEGKLKDVESLHRVEITDEDKSPANINNNEGRIDKPSRQDMMKESLEGNMNKMDPIIQESELEDLKGDQQQEEKGEEEDLGAYSEDLEWEDLEDNKTPFGKEEEEYNQDDESDYDYDDDYYYEDNDSSNLDIFTSRPEQHAIKIDPKDQQQYYHGNVYHQQDSPLSDSSDFYDYRPKVSLSGKKIPQQNTKEDNEPDYYQTRRGKGNNQPNYYQTSRRRGRYYTPRV